MLWLGSTSTIGVDLLIKLTHCSSGLVILLISAVNVFCRNLWSTTHFYRAHKESVVMLIFNNHVPTTADLILWSTVWTQIKRMLNVYTCRIKGRQSQWTNENISTVFSSLANTCMYRHYKRPSELKQPPELQLIPFWNRFDFRFKFHVKERVLDTRSFHIALHRISNSAQSRILQWMVWSRSRHQTCTVMFSASSFLIRVHLAVEQPSADQYNIVNFWNSETRAKKKCETPNVLSTYKKQMLPTLGH